MSYGWLPNRYFLNQNAAAVVVAACLKIPTRFSVPYSMFFVPAFNGKRCPVRWAYPLQFTVLSAMGGAGVSGSLWELSLMQLYVEDRLDWSYQSIDGAITKAPLGGGATGANPRDRGKKGLSVICLPRRRPAGRPACQRG